MTLDDYRTTHGINYSALKVGRTSLPRMHAIITGTAEQSQSDSLSLGTMLHEAMQHGEAFVRGYAIRPDGIDRRTKAGKEEFASWLSSLPEGVVPVSASESDAIKTAEAMRQAIWSHPVAGKLAETHGDVEAPLHIDGRKARPDKIVFVNYKPAMIVDWKTCVDSTPSGFARSAARYGYAQQAAWYVDMVRRVYGVTIPFVFVAVESAAPHCVGVYQLAADQVQAAAKLNESICTKYAEWLQKGGIMHHTVDTIETLVLPEWAVTDNTIPSGFDLAAESF